MSMFLLRDVHIFAKEFLTWIEVNYSYDGIIFVVGCFSLIIYLIFSLGIFLFSILLIPI